MKIGNRNKERTESEKKKEKKKRNNKRMSIELAGWMQMTQPKLNPSLKYE